jgi:ADP-ribose pyrophosphatase YjhB (NUDIX family)
MCVCLHPAGQVTGIVFVRRKDVDKYALPGGFVDVGETVEQAVHREVRRGLASAPSTKDRCGHFSRGAKT